MDKITWYEIAGILARAYSEPEGLEIARKNPEACRELLRMAQEGKTSDKYIIYMQQYNLI